METFGSRSYVATGRVLTRVAITADLPTLVTFETVEMPFATDQDLSALAAIRSTERGVMQVGLMRVRRGSPHLASPCDGAQLRILRGAARLALCCEPRGVGRNMPVGLLFVMPLGHRDLWDTRHVKSELAARAMPEGKVFLYFLAITAFDWLQFTAFRIRPNPEPLSLSAQFEAWFGFGITVVGVVFLFLCNGGSRGKDFLYRYFPLSVVVGWKFVVAMVVASWALSLVLAGQTDNVTRWSVVALGCLLNAIMFLRIGQHLKALSREATA